MVGEKASIIIATHNRSDILKKTLNAMLLLDYPSLEIIVVNDASTDNTRQILSKFSGNVNFVNLEKNTGPAAARNIGIKKATGKYIVIMDDDCIPKKDWLKNLLKPFGGNVGMTSSFDIYGGGTSTAFLKTALDKTGLFDERFPYPYREDTDLVFRVMEEGYEVKPANAAFDHIHKSPIGLSRKIRYGLKRIKYHSVDPLLYKKHREKTKVFLDVKLGFIRNPMADFAVATGLWGRKKGESSFSFSSPQGVVLLSNKTALHTMLIILFGFSYVVLVKLARLYGSLKYRTLLL